MVSGYYILNPNILINVLFRFVGESRLDIVIFLEILW